MQGFIGRVDFLQILPGRYQILTMEATEDSNREHFLFGIMANEINDPFLLQSSLQKQVLGIHAGFPI